MEQLHPNWRALATVHIPLKRFILEGVAEAATMRDSERYRIESGTGKEVRNFYETVVAGAPAASKRIREEHKTKESAMASAKKPNKLPFDRNKFFRCAMENRAENLTQFDAVESTNLNAADAFGWTALMMAACEGAAAAVQALLDMGADRDVREKCGYSAADLARKHGHFNIVHMLEQTASPDQLRTETVVCKASVKPFYCDACKQTFGETTWRQHQTSTVHQFNVKSALPPNKLVKFNMGPNHRGLHLMVKQGWDAASGLGPEQNGRLYPVKTVIRKQRTGLGIEQAPARVTHFEAFDARATQRQNSNYYRRKPRNRNDMEREKKREWKRERRLRNALS